ncbi:MAG TPA: hypothetical protein VGV40_04035 [Solirubrobacteraceae bacterium]|nr:hypothetical protein [Solirubrobacteraceae bacterium]
MRRIALVTLLLAGLATGCGDNSEGAGDPGERLPADAQAEVTDARDRIRALCREGVPRPQDLRPAVADLVAVLEQYPGRVVQGGEFDRTRPVRRAALLAADNLEDCGAERLADELREAVARVS